jgi:hypothetical protein
MNDVRVTDAMTSDERPISSYCAELTRRGGQCCGGGFIECQGKRSAPDASTRMLGPLGDIEWAEPQPIPRGRAQTFVDALRCRPGKWAKYPTSVAKGGSSTTYATNHPGTEWASRKRSDGRYDLYARWIGGDA